MVKGFLRSQDPDIVLLQETKRGSWDKCFLVSVWKGGERDWAVLPTCRTLGGVVIIWDLIKFECSEKVTESFFVSIKLKFEEEGFFLVNFSVWFE